MTAATARTRATAALVFLAIAVGIRMFIVRTREMHEHRIDPHAVDNS